MSDGTGDSVFVGFQPLDPDTLSTCKSPAKDEENDSNDNSLNSGKTSSKCDKSNEEKIPANGIQTKENDVEEESIVEKIKTLENKDVEVDKTKEVDSCSVKVNLKDNVLNVDNKSSTEHLKDKELELDSAVPVELGKECEKKLAQPDSDSCAGDMKSLFEEEDEKVCDKTNSVDDNSLEGSKNDVVKEVESKQQTNKPDKIKNGENKENILNTSGESSNSITKSENECVLPESDKILKIIPSATQNKEDDELPVDDCDSDDDKMVIDEDISENPLQPHLVNDSKLTGAKKRKQKLASRVIEDNEYDDMEVAEVNSEKDEKNESSELPPDPEDGDYIICPMTGERIQKVIPTAVVEIDNDDNVDPGNEVGEDNYSDDDYHPSMGDKILTKHPKKKKVPTATLR